LFRVLMVRGSHPSDKVVDILLRVTPSSIEHLDSDNRKVVHCSDLVEIVKIQRMPDASRFFVFLSKGRIRRYVSEQREEIIAAIKDNMQRTLGAVSSRRLSFYSFSSSLFPCLSFIPSLSIRFLF